MPDGTTGSRVESAVGSEGLREMGLLAEELKHQVHLTAGRFTD